MGLMTLIGPVLILLVITESSICEELPSKRIEKFQSTGKKNNGPGKVESRFFGPDGIMGQLFPGSGNNQGPQSGGTPTNLGGTGFPANSQFYPGGAVQNQNWPPPADSTGIDDAKNYPLQNNPGIQQYPNQGNFGPNQNQGNFGGQNMPGVNPGNFGGFRPGQNTGFPQNPNQRNFNGFPQQRPGQGNFGGMQYPGQGNNYPMQYPNQNGGMPNQFPNQNDAGRFPQMQFPNQGNFGGTPQNTQFPNQGNVGGPQQIPPFPNQGNFGPTQAQYPNQGNFGGLPQNMQYPNQGIGAAQVPYPNQGNVGMQTQFPNQGNFGNPAYPDGGMSQVPIPIPDQDFPGGTTSVPDFDEQQFPTDGGFGNQNNQGSGQVADGTVDSLLPDTQNNQNGFNPQMSDQGPLSINQAAAILGRPVIIPPETSGDKIVFPESADSPSQRQCVQDCQTTTEYNPVCGTNNVTYINPGKFVCARNCGVAVYVHRRGRCPDTTPTSRPIIG